jgi:hypothetical protein
VAVAVITPKALPLRLLRRLDLEAGSEPDRPSFLSSASGLICTAGEICVVADDELHLGRFTPDPARPGKLLRLFSGDLPDKAKKRKKRKPDMEVLLQLPRSADYPHGALLALGSGSGPLRRRGAIVALGVQGRVVGRPRSIAADGLFARLSQSFSDLNLEGGWVAAGQLCLLQRGNKGDSPNAVLHFDLKAVLRSLRRDRCLPDVDPLQVRERDLGEVRGVPLCFTDASPLPDGGWLFSAVAENIANSYADGPCVGAAIGRVDARGRMRWIRSVSPLYKIEGIDAQLKVGKLRALLVTDADDPAVPACLLQVYF